jgi:hypothetical protein
LVTIASGFDNPVGLAHAGDDRLFVIEKDGYIRIVDTTGQVLPTAFLNIDAKVNSEASERGMLGLAFHPEYDQNGFFYVNYTNNGGHTVVARYSRDSSDPDLADPNSESILMTVNQPFSNHNGGHLVFGPDGYLYIGLGDGGSAGDPGDRAQNGALRLGKMMRIDVNVDTLFGIPPDNPFLNDTAVLDEIWALGLRNPWRYSFDRLTGDLWIADVGQNAWEEINFQPAGSSGGENYGWRCLEGFEEFNTSGCPSLDVFIDPVHAYPHGGGFCGGSITGGYVYRGVRNEYLYGKFIYADYCTGIFGAVERDAEGNIEAEDLADLQNQQFTSFGEDASGELYVTAGGGTLYRVDDLVSSVRDPYIVSERVQPNPVTQSFTISGEGAQSIDYTMLSIEGKVILKGITAFNDMIDCSALEEGVYLLEYHLDQKAFMEKLVIVR